jgi:hypothetical protein
MGHSREAGTQHLAERWGWQAARRDEARVARRLYRNEVVDGVYRLDEGARLDAFFPCLRELGGLEWLAGVQGTAWPRELVPGVQDLRRSGVKTLGGMERMKALPVLRCRAAALLPWVGLHAPQVRHGVCQRGAATRQRPRPEGPMGSATVAHHRVPRHLRDLEAWFNGTMQALAKAGIFGA